MQSLKKYLPRITTWTSIGSFLFGLIAIVGWSTVTWHAVRHGELFFKYPGRYRFIDILQRVSEAGTLLHGGNLYPLIDKMSNTTPPFVTLFLYVPLRSLGHAGAEWSITFLSLLSFSISGAILLQRTGAMSWKRGWIVTGWILIPIAIMGSNPFRILLLDGQIRAILLVLVVIDLLVVPRKWRGVLIGVAAGISITPIAFLLVAWCSAGVRSVVRGLLAFAGTALLGVLAGFHASQQFWSLLASGEEAKRMVYSKSFGYFWGYPPNSSLQGTLDRLPLHLSTALQQGLYVAALAVTGALLVVIVSRMVASGLMVNAILLVGVWSTALAPAAWTHYWVWTLLAPFAAAEAWKDRRLASFGSMIVIAACTGPTNSIGLGIGLVGTRHGFFGFMNQFVSQNVYVLAALTYFILVCVSLLGPSSSDQSQAGRRIESHRVS